MPTYDPYWANVTLLCNFDNGYTDSAKNHQFVAVGNSYISISTAQHKFGASSLLSTSRNYGEAGYIRCTDVNSDFHFENEMTIEFFFYTSDITTNGSIFGAGNLAIVGGTALNTNRIAMHIYNGFLGVSLEHKTPSSILATETIYNNNIFTNTWNHVAITRDSSNNVRLFCNGILSESNPNGYKASIRYFDRDLIEYITSFCIGSYELYGSTILGAGGYIDSFRITKGIARYTANFTPPTESFEPFTKQLVIEDSSGNIVHTKSLDGLTTGTYKIPYSIPASTWEGKLKIYTTGMYPNLTKIMDVSCIGSDFCDPYWDDVVLAMHFDGISPVGAYNVVSGTYTPAGIYNSVEDIRIQITNFIRDANGCQPSADWSGCPTISGSSQLIPVIYDNGDSTGTINFTGYYGGSVSVSYNNNIFIDEKGHTVTRSSTGAYISTAQSKFGVSSLRLNGASYLTFPEAALSLATGNWKVSAFVRLDFVGNHHYILGRWNSSGSRGIVIGIDNNDKPYMTISSDGTAYFSVSSPTTIPQEQWVFLTYSRVGNIYSIKANCVQLVSVTQAGNIYMPPGNDWRIGTFNNPPTDSFFEGYMDELKISTGLNVTDSCVIPTEAFYNKQCTAIPIISSNYDPYLDSTILLMHFDDLPLYHVPSFASAKWHETKELACSLGVIEAYVRGKHGIHNTSTDSCQVYNDSDNSLYTTWVGYGKQERFIDEKGHTVTTTSSIPRITTASCYGVGSLISNNCFGSLFSVDSSDFILGTGDFTMEALVFLIDATQDIRIWQTNQAAIPAEIQSSTRRLSAYNAGAITGGDPVPLNQWVHIAYVRKDGILSAFLAGIKQWSNALTYNFTSPFWYPYSNSTANNFKVDELRVTKAARYTSNFTPPTKAFTMLSAPPIITKYQELNWSIGKSTINKEQDLNWVIGPNSYNIATNLNWSTTPIQVLQQELNWGTRPYIEKRVEINYSITQYIVQDILWDLAPTKVIDVNWSIGTILSKELNWTIANIVPCSLTWYITNNSVVSDLNWSIRQWNPQDISWEVE